MTKKKVAIAMSGGVDSGVAAALVVKAGYRAAGFHMHLWSEKIEKKKVENKCCNTESLEAARRTAYQLGIPFYPVDFEKAFKKRVVDYFLEEYASGKTPNPCVMCNRFIKFGRFLDYVRGLGYDFLATGHYARIKKGSLFMGKDKLKDQSYFLYNLKPKQLKQIIFPVGDYSKKRVRLLAKKWKLPVAERPESQEICFFPETDYRPFLQRHLKKKIVEGEVIDLQGKVIGEHQGFPLYTIGQRHGFTVTDRKALGPFYVISKKPKENQLVVGFGKEAERQKFRVKDVNWLDKKARFKAERGRLKCQARIRHQGDLLKAEVKDSTVSLTDPEKGVASGQAAVFYRKEAVLGGGIIDTR